MAKVTGIGGVFFKSTSDHKKLAQWYSQQASVKLRTRLVDSASTEEQAAMVTTLLMNWTI